MPGHCERTTPIACQSSRQSHRDDPRVTPSAVVGTDRQPNRLAWRPCRSGHRDHGPGGRSPDVHRESETITRAPRSTGGCRGRALRCRIDWRCTRCCRRLPLPPHEGASRGRELSGTSTPHGMFESCRSHRDCSS